MTDSNAAGISAFEKRARSWDRWVTIVIVACLFIPLPFARFESWPAGQVLADHIVTPWSRFRVCYAAFPDGLPTEETFAFTWKARIIPGNPSPILPRLQSLHPPLLKWQDGPEVELKESFYRGDLLQVKTSWQPVVLWPFRLGARIQPLGLKPSPPARRE
jgi:hypothetical protein